MARRSKSSDNEYYSTSESDEDIHEEHQEEMSDDSKESPLGSREKGKRKRASGSDGGRLSKRTRNGDRKEEEVAESSKDNHSTALNEILLFY